MKRMKTLSNRCFSAAFAFGFALAWILLLLPSVSSGEGCTTPAFPEARVRPGFCAWIWKDGLKNPRGIDKAPNGDLLIVDRGSQQILVAWEDPQSGQAKTAVLAQTNDVNLNHHIKYHKGFIYASSSTTVFRWNYSDESKFRQRLGERQVVVQNIPKDGAHETRTMEFDSQDRIYINIGSQGNIDENSQIRSKIVRFELTNAQLPLDYNTKAFTFANGTRNECGLRFDNRGRLWGVENGFDNLGVAGQRPQTRLDFGDMHLYNPAEEVNLFLEENAGKFYGYPFCWSEGPNEKDPSKPSFPQGGGPLTQWSTFNQDPFTDQWCKNKENNVPPVWALPGHSAPLDMLFYYGDTIPSWKGRVAFIPRHGSWNRPWNEATGRSVDLLLLDNDGMPVGLSPLFAGPDPTWRYRPVSVVIAPCQAYKECLFVTDDNSGAIIAIGYGGGDNSSVDTPWAPPVQPPPSSTDEPQPPAAPIVPNQWYTIKLGFFIQLSYRWNEVEGTISFSVRRNGGTGYFACGFNYDGNMTPTQAVLAYSQSKSVSEFATILVDSYIAEEIIATRGNRTAVPWGISDVSYSVLAEEDATVLNFTRPLKTISGGFDIQLDGKLTYMLFAWHSILPASFSDSSPALPLHTGQGSYPIFFNNATVYRGPEPWRHHANQPIDPDWKPPAPVSPPISNPTNVGCISRALDLALLLVSMIAALLVFC